MVPPLKPLRLRSIERWLKDQACPPPDQRARALELDEQMIEAFEAKEDAAKASMMAAGTWGTAEGMQSFPAARMALWGETVADYLRSEGE